MTNARTSVTPVLAHPFHILRHALQRLSTIEASYSIHGPCRRSLRRAPRRCPSLLSRQLLLPRASSSTIPGQRRDQCLKATSPERCHRGIEVVPPLLCLHWLALTHCRSLASRSAPRCHQITARCYPCRRGQADKWKARAIAMKDEGFLSLVLWQPGRRAMDSKVTALWDPRPTLKFSISIAAIVDQLSRGETMADKERKRKQGPDELQRERGTGSLHRSSQHMPGPKYWGSWR